MKINYFYRGQSLLDLALIIGVVSLVILGMQIYLQRGLQGKVKDLTDYVISNQQKAADAKNDYDRHSDTSFNTEQTEETFEGGARSLIRSESSSTEYRPGP